MRDGEMVRNGEMVRDGEMGSPFALDLSAVTGEAFENTNTSNGAVAAEKILIG